MRGYTLIEMLVALVIVSVVATSVALALPDPLPTQQSASVRAWQKEAQALSSRAMAEGRVLGWAIDERRATPVAGEGPRAALELAPGLVVEAVEVEGARLPLPAHIRFSEVPVLFVIRVTGGERRWQLASRPSGAIDLVGPP